MKHTITISDDVYQQLADLAIGFDTPERVIQRLIDNFHSSDMHENKFISNKKVPNSEDHKEVMRALEIAKEKQSNKSIDCPPDIKKEVISEIEKPKKTDKDLIKKVSKVPESIEDIYSLVKNVYEKKVTEQDAKNILISKFDISVTLATDYIDIFYKIREGKHYKRSISDEIIDSYLRNIYSDYGIEGLNNALLSLKKHIAYRKNFLNKIPESLEALYERYIKNYPTEL